MESADLSKKWKMSCALLLIALPALVFYFILFRTAVNLPILDDYEIILGTTNFIAQTHDVTSKLAILLTSEHNGYKLMFENGVVWMLFGLTGRIHILPLVALGDAFALFIFVTVALMAKISTANATTKYVVLAPVAFLIFQLQYASALNFASSSLQHLAVIAFSLLSIYLLSRKTRSTFLVSCFTSILAIASSPNGFFLAPIGVFMLAQEKRWKGIAAWLVLIASALGFYLFRYGSGASSASTGSEASTGLLQHINPMYALSFVGASAARYSSVLPGVLLGIALCCIVGFAAVRRYFLQNPAVFYSMVFILINAVAVSGLRSDSGLAQSLASRYRTYSNLMLAFSYLFFVENVLSQWKNVLARRAAIIVALVVSMTFCMLSDIAGARFLGEKKLALTQTYERQWQNAATGSVLSNSEMDENPALKRQLEAGVYNVNLPIMRQSVRLGIYQPPQLP
jgi:hypothetical protein